MSYPNAYAPPAPVFVQPMPVLVPAPRRTGPPSVHVIAVLQYLGGLGSLAVGALFGYLSFVAARDTGSEENFFSPETIATAFGVAAGVCVVVGVIAIALGRFLQLGRQWARVVVLMLSVLSVIIVAGSIVVHSAELYTAVTAAYPVLCLALLNTRAARSWFRLRTW